MPHGECLMPMVDISNPWAIIALAATYRQEAEAFREKSVLFTSIDSIPAQVEAVCFDRMAEQAEWMLTALEQLAGLILHNDKTYFTWGPGNEEYLKNTGEEHWPIRTMDQN